MQAVRFSALAICLAMSAASPAWSASGGVLVSTEGTVQARTTTLPRWHPAAVRSAYMPGDSLMTGRRSRAGVALTDGTVTRLAPASILQFPKSAEASFGRLLLGRLWLKVAKQHAPMAIHTPGAVATVIGTELIVTVDGEENTRVACLEGQVNVQGLVGAVVTLKAGQGLDVRMGAAAEPPTPVDVKRWRSADPLLASLKQGKAPEDDDPEGYKSLMRQLQDQGQPSEPATAFPE
ncbi:MAG: FecR domain-containing protein [Candidatus Sericytochromatia bacterium]|nr:FecR domain-containing protein [Candidatus Sericytochromatia bacterium]